MTEQDNTKQNRKNAMVAYLLSHIFNTKKITYIDNTKINRLVYLAWLEYASLYPENTIPQTSPMRALEFYNYELGPVDLSISDNMDSIKQSLSNGHIPCFKDLGFNSSEQVQILNVCSFIRRRCSHLTTKALADFITNNLPASWNRPRYNKIDFNKNGIFEREMRVYKNVRHLLKPQKTNTK